VITNGQDDDIVQLIPLSEGQFVEYDLGEGEKSLSPFGFWALRRDGGVEFLHVDEDEAGIIRNSGTGFRLVWKQ